MMRGGEERNVDKQSRWQWEADEIADRMETIINIWT